MSVKRILLIASLIGLIFSGSAFTDSKDLKVGRYQPEIGTLVANFMAIYHYQGMSLDDEISRRLLKNYLEMLDYNKLFFLASDIEQFKSFETHLDDDLRANPTVLDRAFVIHNIYRKRVAERSKYILSQLGRNFDFNAEERYYIERNELPWAKSAKELDEVWQLRIKEEILRFKLQKREPKDYLDILTKRYERLQVEVAEEDESDVVERFLTALALSFDPHSIYFKPMSKENFDIQMGHSLEGIGATLSREGEYTVIVDLVEGGPAERSGKVFPEDKVVAVAQAGGDFEDVVDMRLDKVVKKIRGPKGTTVRLQIISAGAKDFSETKVVSLVREKVELTSLDAKAEIKDVEGPDGKTSKLGVITLPSFYLDNNARNLGDPNYKSTTRDVRRLIGELEKKGIEGLVIDLRRNGGGSLDEAIELTGLFIDDGPVVQIRNRRRNVNIEEDPDPGQAYAGPLLVLTNEFSASASEIFAGAIQDYERGLVVGSKSTHGKGTVQQVYSLEPTLERLINKRLDEDVAGALKLTTHKFYRISGGATQFKGVEPDLVLPSPFDGLKVKEESLDYALAWDEIRPAEHKSYGLVADVLPVLKTASARRIAQNPEFRYIREDTAERDTLRATKYVSLKLEDRIKEREDREKVDKARDEERRSRISLVKTEGKPESGKSVTDRVLVPDFVLEEGLFILRDYVDLHRTERLASILPKKDAL